MQDLFQRLMRFILGFGLSTKNKRIPNYPSCKLAPCLAKTVEWEEDSVLFVDCSSQVSK